MELEKFKGEPDYVRYFYNLILEGEGSITTGLSGNTMILSIEKVDIELYPELDGFSMIELLENNDGFVTHELLKDQRVLDFS